MHSLFSRGALSATIGLAACGGSRPAPVRVPLIAEVAAESLVVAPALPRATEPRSWSGLDTATQRIPMLIATTRRPIDAERPGFRYGTTDANQLYWGLAQVSVPSYRVRAEGNITRPNSGPNPDTRTEMFMNSLLPADSVRFLQRVAEDLARTQSREILVFVHGYNSSFEDGAVRLAQLVADMGFDGTAVLFSWPSAGAVCWSRT